MREAKLSGQPHFYMMELTPGLIIDARAKGNLARLINSSCAPNCESQKWHDPTGLLSRSGQAARQAARQRQPCGSLPSWLQYLATGLVGHSSLQDTFTTRLGTVVRPADCPPPWAIVFSREQPQPTLLPCRCWCSEVPL